MKRKAEGGRGKAARPAKRSGRAKPGRAPRGKASKATTAQRQGRALEIVRGLKERFPDARCELNYENAYQLLVATILSAQCTDVRVNMVTPVLFARYPTPAELAVANPTDVEEIIRSTGFYRNKTRSLIGMANALVERYRGEVPRTMDELRPIPGVGRKTANVVLGNAYNVNEGITVDTHVLRTTRLLGLTRESEAEKVERDLMELVPREDWTIVSHLLIFLGRRICIARRPQCWECPLNELCPSADVATR